MKNWFVALVAGCLVFGFLAIPAISQDAPKDDSVGADSTEDPKAFAAEKATFRALKALRKHSSGLAGTGKEEDAELSLHYHAGFCFVVPYDLASRDKKTYEALAIENLGFGVKVKLVARKGGLIEFEAFHGHSSIYVPGDEIVVAGAPR